jgi:acyl transferase domain-containing protein
VVHSEFQTCRAFSDHIDRGSVKANIGHLEGGSGLAGILKCIMILEKGLIPPNALFEKMNPRINAKLYNIQVLWSLVFESRLTLTRSKVPTACIPWPGEGLRRISVNSFGFGGSNGHIILDDAYHSLKALGLNGNHHTLVSSGLQIPTVNGKTTNGTITSGATMNGALTNGKTETGILTNGKTTIGTLTNGTTHHDTPPEVPDGIPESLQGIDKSSVDSLDPAHNDSVIGPLSSNSESAPTVNGTTILEDPKPTSKLQLLVWSARDEAALQRMLQQYSTYYQTHISGSWDQVESLAYTLAARRSVMTWRSFAVVGADVTNNHVSLPSSNSVRSSRETGIAFIFTGQGAQYAKMGMELLQFPVFQSTLDKASRVFRDLGAEWSLLGKSPCAIPFVKQY